MKPQASLTVTEKNRAYTLGHMLEINQRPTIVTGAYAAHGFKSGGYVGEGCGGSVARQAVFVDSTGQ